MKKVEGSRLKLAGILYIMVITALVIALSYSADVRNKSIEEEDIPEEPKPVEEVVTTTLAEEDDNIVLEVVEDVPSYAELIDEYVRDTCTLYDNVEPELVMSVIWHESRYNPDAVSSTQCVGLMQISPFWHKTRAYELGVEDFFDPKGNILLGVDYLSELIKQYEDVRLALMLYNMDHDAAFELYNKGEISYYAKSVLERAEMLKNGGV